MCQAWRCHLDAEDVGQRGRRKYTNPRGWGLGGWSTGGDSPTEGHPGQALRPSTQHLLRGCSLDSSLPQSQALQLCP